ncbi:hypothetical protein ACQCSX_02490 [Pseudarthrobacter sp. P1]|uniref:hypothetical protein n=1 Tax=Pseudarthrobacter sp. P1 TaxID=3418418 RepID=UPI003CE833AF
MKNVLKALGGGASTPPALWEYNPATGAISSLGILDPQATLARAVAATATTVFFGAGSILGDGGATSKTSLFAYDRAQDTFTSMHRPRPRAIPAYGNWPSSVTISTTPPIVGSRSIRPPPRPLPTSI